MVFLIEMKKKQKEMNYYHKKKIERKKKKRIIEKKKIQQYVNFPLIFYEFSMNFPKLVFLGKKTIRRST